MSKAGTMYNEGERLVTAKQLDTFGLNPFAFWIMIENYVNHIAPLPIKYVWHAQGKDRMDEAAESKSIVELYIMQAGYLGNKIGDISKLDITATNLFCQSYYTQMRPLPISFTVFDAVEIHFRTPGQSDFDKKKKNPLRNIFDPTAKKSSSKKKS